MQLKTVLSGRRKAFITSSALACSFLTSIVGQSQTYSVKDLGRLFDVSGFTEAYPRAINNQGQVSLVNAQASSYRAFLYTSNLWTDLGTLGGSEAFAAGVNDSGQVAGYSLLGSGASHAFIWTPGGIDGASGNPQMKDLGTLGGVNSQAAAVNKTGLVTGFSDASGQPNPRQHAFIYDGKKLVDIGGLLPGLPNSYGYGINASGHVAGTAYDQAYTFARAFFYNGTTAVDIGSLGGVAASALSINDSDHIAGYLTTTDFLDHAFVYSGGVMTDLGTLGGNYSYGISINNNHVVVGGSFTDPKDSIYHAFVFANGAMKDLNTLLDQTGTGWTLVEARAINDRGQIVGTGTFSGANHAFLLEQAQSSRLTIAAINIYGPNVVIRFPTVAQGTYTVQASQNLGTSSWSDLVTGLAGTGSIISSTNSIGAATHRFYRIKQTSP